jgi:hypothetical protein
VSRKHVDILTVATSFYFDEEYNKKVN